MVLSVFIIEQQQESTVKTSICEVSAMGSNYKIMYRVQCRTCGALFTLPRIIDHIPRHPPLGSRIRPDVPWDPCSGSGVQGKLIESVYQEVPPDELAKEEK